MIIRPRETVILADHFDELVSWYRDTLGFEIKQRFDTPRYANLETETGIRIGIAPARDVDVIPGDRKHNTVVQQVEVSDVGAFMEHVVAHGAARVFGPTKDEAGFEFGAIADPEGNQIWVVDENCP